MIGQIVGNYKILQALGEGGVGMVYKGVDTMLDREVAVKVLRPELASQTSVVERFRSEAVTLAKLSHPNIATLFSLFRHGGDLFMVLEFVSGESLETVIQRRGRLSVEETIPIFCQALDGIGHAHQAGIIHRDIKPSNMILTEAGAIKVLDFGIARLLGSSRMTRVGNIIGTLEYMSPEQVRGEETDARSDIYGLGMMLYELLTGKLPFESDNEFSLMKMQIEQMPAPPRQLNADIPEQIENAIMKAVAKNPAERFQNAGEFLETLLTVDIPMSAVGSFGLNSIYQSRIHTRPSKPGIEKTGAITEVLPQTDQNNLPTEVFNESIQSDLPTEILNESISTDDETGEFIPKKHEDSTILMREEQDIDAPSPEIKQTRLGQDGNVSVGQKVIKPTSLGVFEHTSESYAENETVSPSFFEKLTWTHYAGACAIVVILLSVIGLAAIIPKMFSGGASEQPTANNETGKKESETKTENNKKTSSGDSRIVSDAPETTSQSPGTFGETIVPKEASPTDSSSVAERAKSRPAETKKETPAETKNSGSKTSTKRENTRASESKKSSSGSRSTTPVSSSTPNLSDN